MSILWSGFLRLKRTYLCMINSSVRQGSVNNSNNPIFNIYIDLPTTEDHHEKWGEQ